MEWVAGVGTAFCASGPFADAGDGFAGEAFCTALATDFGRAFGALADASTEASTDAETESKKRKIHTIHSQIYLG